MKINNDNSNPVTGAADALGGVTPSQTAGAPKPGPAPTPADQLTLSPEARMMQAVAETAAEPPAIRQEVVDRMRALLDRGELGNDAGRLADAIVSDWLKQP